MNSLNTRRGRPVRSGNNSTRGEKTAERLGAATRSLLSRITLGAAILGVLLIVGLAVVVWFKKVYADPEHVFWATIANSLSSQGVTKEINERTNQATTCQELTQVLLTPQPMVRDIKKFDAQTAGGPTKVAVETLSTPRGDYTHYVSIDRPASKSGKKLDYSSVYGLWIKNSGSGRCNGSPIFGNALFGAVLFGELKPADKKAVLNLLRDAYEVEFSHVTRHTENGRRTYSFNASLSLRNYAKAARRYAERLGLPNSQQINSASYTVENKLPLIITIDVLAHEVKQIDYKSSGAVEKYSGYGIKNDVSLPDKTVNIEKLQKSLNAIK